MKTEKSYIALSYVYRLQNNFFAEIQFVKKALALFPYSNYFCERNLALSKKELKPRPTLSFNRHHNFDLRRVCIVTGGDQYITKELKECVESIKATKFYKDCTVHVFNCEDSSLEWFFPIKKILKYDFIKQKHNILKEFSLGYKVLLLRPYLDQIVPGYDYYIWINPTFWIQDERGLDEYIAFAEQQGYASSVPHSRSQEICDGICCIHKDFFPGWRKMFEKMINLDLYDYFLTEKSAACALKSYKTVPSRWFSYLYQPLVKNYDLSTLYDYFNPEYPMALINTKFIFDTCYCSFHQLDNYIRRSIYTSTRYYQFTLENYKEVYEEGMYVLSKTMQYL